MRKTMLLPVGLFLLIAAGAGAPAWGQVLPFFNGGASAFDPEISIVNSGAVLDAQAVVSNDRKYVTLTMRAQNSRLLALREFTFQNPGNLGGPVGFPAALPPGANNANRAAAPSVLQREGMVRIRPRGQQ